VRGWAKEDTFDCHRPLTDRDSLDKKKREVGSTRAPIDASMNFCFCARSSSKPAQLSTAARRQPRRTHRNPWTRLPAP